MYKNFTNHGDLSTLNVPFLEYVIEYKVENFD